MIKKTRSLWEKALNHLTKKDKDILDKEFSKILEEGADKQNRKEFVLGQLVIFNNKVCRLTGELFHHYIINPILNCKPIDEVFQHLPDDMSPFINQK